MSTCSRCGAEFSCGMVDDKSGAPCWCTQFPLMPMPCPSGLPGSHEASCYCPACLRQLSGALPAATDRR